MTKADLIAALRKLPTVKLVEEKEGGTYITLQDGRVVALSLANGVNALTDGTPLAASATPHTRSAPSLPEVDVIRYWQEFYQSTRSRGIPSLSFASWNAGFQEAFMRFSLYPKFSFNQIFSCSRCEQPLKKGQAYQCQKGTVEADGFVPSLFFYLCFSCFHGYQKK